VIVTDKLASYQVAHRELMASVQHRRSKYLNSIGPRTRINRPGTASGR
jgi:transposase-like protein